MPFQDSDKALEEAEEDMNEDLEPTTPQNPRVIHFLDTETSTGMETQMHEKTYSVINISVATLNLESSKVQIMFSLKFKPSGDLHIETGVESLLGVTNSEYSVYNEFSKEDAVWINSQLIGKKVYAHNAQFDHRVLKHTYA